MRSQQATGILLLNLKVDLRTSKGDLKMSMDDWRYDDHKMKVREQALVVLMSKFGGQMEGAVLNTHRNQSMSVLMTGYPRVICILQGL